MIPFFIAVTGHRDVSEESIPLVTEAVRRVLMQQRELMTNTEVVVISALAEGADRLVAQVALDCNCKLWAVLPTESEEYTTDFSSKESISEYYHLKSCASEVISAPLTLGKSRHSNARPDIYVDTANVLGSLANLLIAVWDGNPEEKPGGTSHTVRLFRSGECCVYDNSNINYPFGGPVIHIACARKSRSPVVVSTRWLPGRHESDNQFNDVESSASDRSAFNKSLVLLDQVNGRLNGRTSTKANTEQHNFNQESETKKVAFDALMIFNRLEHISAKAQWCRTVSLIWIMLCFVLFNLATLLYDGLASGPVPLVIGLIFLGASSLLYSFQRVKRSDEFWVGTRVIAEFLRISLTLSKMGERMLNPRKLVSEGLDQYDWIAIAWKSIHSLSILHSPRVTLAELDRRAIITEWCTGQISYFEGEKSKICYHSTMAKRYQKVSTLTLIAALVVYLLILTFEIFCLPAAAEQSGRLSTAAIYVYWSLLSVGTVCASISYLSGHNEHSNSFRQAVIKFRLAIDLLPTAGGSKLDEIVRFLADGAFRETMVWLRLQRARPVRIPF